jgi:hypothetical protein
MNATQIMHEIRKLNRTDKIEIFRWLDREVAKDLTSRIGIDRSVQIWQEFQLGCSVLVSLPEQRNTEVVDSIDYPDK